MRDASIGDMPRRHGDREDIERTETRMARRSAGLLVYRRSSGELEVLLAHPGGPLWARKDDGAWTIPKGELDDDEDPLSAARREFEEETGGTPAGPFVALDPVRQPGGKVVWVWAVEGEFDITRLVSNTFEMEWPPRSGRRMECPEVDRAGWFTIDVARRKIFPGQAAFLDQLQRIVGHAG
jgi:predicted NUDIX family NTP pyrophosphohydrolase